MLDLELQQMRTFQRSVTWSKQTEDKFIDGAAVTKDRPHYEPSIYPNTNIIQSVGVGSTVIFVSNIRTFFDSSQRKIIMVRMILESFLRIVW